MYSYLSTNDVETNLIDIGCTQEQIKDFMHYFQEKKRKEMYQFLKLHRCKLRSEEHTLNSSHSRLSRMPSSA